MKKKLKQNDCKQLLSEENSTAVITLTVFSAVPPEAGFLNAALR